ncbi:MAG: TMEM175 family protein [Bacteriovorax sp.]
MKKRGFFVESTHRIESFSDGVFAIAITLLILEVKVPRVHLKGTSVAFWQELFNLWPSYLAFAFSFLMIGIYWINHHYIFQLFKRSNHVFGLLNLLFLMAISFLPFPTAVLAEYMSDVAYRHIAIMFYAFGLFLPAITWLMLWIYGSKDYRLIDPNLSSHFVKKLTLIYSAASTFYIVSIALSYFNGILGLISCVALTLLYLLPPLSPEYKKHA